MDVLSTYKKQKFRSCQEGSEPTEQADTQVPRKVLTEANSIGLSGAGFPSFASAFNAQFSPERISSLVLSFTRPDLPSSGTKFPLFLTKRIFSDSLPNTPSISLPSYSLSRETTSSIFPSKFYDFECGIFRRSSSSPSS